MVIAAMMLTTTISSGKGQIREFPITARLLPKGAPATEFEGVRNLFHPGSLFGAYQPNFEYKSDRLSSPVALPDTIYRTIQVTDEEWGAFGGAWSNASKVDMVYDSLGREQERSGWFGFSAFWEPIYNAQFSYDQNGRLTRIINRVWTGGAWQTSSRDSVIYNPYGDPVEETIETFNGSGWDPLQRFLVSYDGSLRPTEIIGQGWASSQWVNAFRYTLLYDPAGLNTEYLNQTWSAGAWMNTLRESYGYDSGERLTETVGEYWAGAMWNNDYRFTWTFDGSGFLVSELSENWKTSAWAPDELITYTNDGAGRPGDILAQYWNGFDWIDETIAYRSYDEDRLVEEFTQMWSGTEWVNFHKTSTAWQMFVTSTTTTRFYPVSDKWNIVSVPLLVADYYTTVVFPAAISSAFAFDAGYVASPTLENGKGYWLKFDGTQSVPVTGEILTNDTVDVATGWNMVGSIGVPVPVLNIATIPGGLVSSSFFGFDAGYQAATVIVPGKGYWVKMAEAGKLVLSGSGNVPVAARIQIALEDATPPPPPGVEGAGQTVPTGYELGQNYPNPFNPVTTIDYTLPADGHVRLSIFNMLGQEVSVLVDGVEGAGFRSVMFDAQNLPSGVYTYRITAGNFTEARKLLLIR